MATEQVVNLRAITIGGKPVSEGGLRVGYGVPGDYLYRQGVRLDWPWRPPAPKPAPVRKKKIDSDGYAYCDHCGRAFRADDPGTYRIPEKTVKCTWCRTEVPVYRPFSGLTRESGRTKTMAANSPKRLLIDYDGDVECPRCCRYIKVARLGDFSVLDTPIVCLECNTKYIAYRP